MVKNLKNVAVNLNSKFNNVAIMPAWVFFSLSLMSINSSAIAERAADSYEWVSIIRLIADPKDFHDKKVYIQGWALIDFENLSICITREPITSKNCLWLNINDNVQSEFGKLTFKDKWQALKQYDKKSIDIKGVFDANDTGHLDGWSGSVKMIYKVEEILPAVK